MITNADLAHFTGSMTLSYDPFFGKRVCYTEGVAHLVHNGCHWLFVDIASNLVANPDVRKVYEEDPFLVIELVEAEHGMDIQIRNDDGDVLAVEHRMTNAIEAGVKFYFIDNVLMLASEY